MFPEYESYDAIGLAELIHQKKISAQEVLTAAIERIELRNPLINAVIFKMYDSAKKNIAHIPPNSFFAGVPFLLKDLLAEYAGFPLSCGSFYARDYCPSDDSEAVKRFKNAGLNILGKTNTPEFGSSPVTEPKIFGPTKNPWDLSRNSGGSSGGSAAAVSARMVPMAHGGDGGGSIRIPASFCGVVGLKPSRGRTPIGPKITRVWQGMVLENVLTRSVRDTAAILDVLSGPEFASPISLPKAQGTFLNSLREPLKPLKIALMIKPWFDVPLDKNYVESLQKIATVCSDLGHTVETTDFKLNAKEIARAFQVILAGENKASLDAFAKILNRPFHPKEVEIVNAMIYSAGDAFTAPEFAQSIQIMDQTFKQLETFFKDYDVLLTLTMPSPAPKLFSLKPTFWQEQWLNFLTHVPLKNFLRKTMKALSDKNFEFTPFTPIYNFSGHPAISLPLAWDENNLPIGFQFAAKFADEKTLLQLAAQLEEALPWKNKFPTAIPRVA